MKRVSSNYFFMARVPHYLGSYTTGYKKMKSKDFLFWVPSGILSLRSSDFVDDFRFAQATSSMTNPYGFMHHRTQKRNSFDFLFWVPSGIRTHDIQNHNLTL